MKDFYYILGLKQTASTEEIKTAHRKLSLKFHPDQNDGDEFFTERFKEIQEAYEILSDSIRRTNFDNEKSQKSQSRHNNYGTNFIPEVEYFRSNKNIFEFGEEVTFSWKTINADKVTLKPIGTVQSIGQKTYKLKDYKNPTQTFDLIAENTNINRQVKSTLILKNKTFEDQYQFFKNKIYQEKSESTYGSEYKQPNHSNQRPKENKKSQKELDAEADSIATPIFVFLIIVIGIVITYIVSNHSK